jgi:hypothetical protein
VLLSVERRVFTNSLGVLRAAEGGKSGMTHDEWRLLGYGILTASLGALVLVPILIHDRKFPRSIAEGIMGAIALAVFLFSKYMEQRKKPNSK